MSARAQVKLFAFWRCPKCGAAAEDGRKLRVKFRGIVCFWCGARISERELPADRWGAVDLLCVLEVRCA